MKNFEQKTAEIYPDIADSYTTAKKSLFARYSWLLGLITSFLFIFSTVFVYERFLKSSHPITFSKAISNKIARNFTEKITISKGQTFGKILSSYGVSYQNINKILKAAALKEINLERLMPGQVLEVQYSNDANKTKTLKYLTAKLNHKTKLKITKDQKTNLFKASIIPISLLKEFIPFTGKIKNSLMVSAIHAGVPVSSIIEAINACSYEVDFQREIQNGDSFKILLEKFTSKEDGSSFFGKTMYFSLDLKKRKYNVYKYKPKNMQEDFFTNKYQSAKRGLLKTPVEASRISSRFGMRKHPVLGFTRMHKGVDFAAPSGTSIFSAGDGVILKMGRSNGMGKYIKIKHNSKLTTVYGHISRFAKKLKRGSRVKQGQVVAFVGMTGRATGPHLHYEIISRGRHVNPLKFKLPSTKILRGQDITSFKKHKTYIDSLLGNKLFS